MNKKSCTYDTGSCWVEAPNRSKDRKFGASNCHFLQLKHQRPHNLSAGLLFGVIVWSTLD